MKHLLLLLSILFFTSLQSVAYEFPRWQFFPVSTAIQEHEKAPIIQRAFSEWETRTGKAKFQYVNPVKRRPSLMVKILDAPSPNAENGSISSETIGEASMTPYVQGYGQVSTNRTFQSDFYSRITIVIYLKYPNSNVRMNDDEIYAAALHQIGHALGLKHSSNHMDIMFGRITNVTHLSVNDIKAFNAVYKP